MIATAKVEVYGKLWCPPLWCTVALGLLSACGATGDSREADRDDHVVSALTGTELVSGDILGIPATISLIGDRLVVVDRAGAPFVHIINPATGTIVRSIGRKGEGPGEYRSVRSVAGVPGDREHAWIFDMEAQRMTLVSLNDTLNDGELRPLRMFDIAPRPVSDPLWMGPERILAGGLLQEATFVEIDGEGRTGAVAGPPPPGPESIAPNFRIMFYQGRYTVRPDRRLIARSYQYAGRIDIFDQNGELVRNVQVPESFEPVISEPSVPGGPPAWELAENGRGYVGIASSDDYIFGLFSGVDFDELPAVHTAGRRIDVFDWEGRHLRTLTLDVDNVAGIEVDPAAERLWLVVHDPVPAIRVYSLRDVL